MFLKIQESVPVVNCGKGKPGPCADGESPVADDKESMEVRTPKQVVDAMKEKMSKIPVQKLEAKGKNKGQVPKRNISGIVAAIDNQDLTKTK